jgi:23S rRNA pseudouridine1911/1915/1917 synthase
VPTRPLREPIRILYEDDALLIASKPSGVLSVPTPGAEGATLLDLLERQGVRALPVHRLDREVSGAILLARNASSKAALEQLFRDRTIEKRYWALSLNGPTRDSGEIKFPILEQGARARVSALGKPSLTRYRVTARGRRANEVDVELVTGRYNQIRLHFAHSGWPLVGDRKYGRFKEDPFRFPRVALHCRRLAFHSPSTGTRVDVEAPLPPELVELRERAIHG